jgi:CRP/FNR family cyclic AMP-dependent transcriptional regulator
MADPKTELLRRVPLFAGLDRRGLNEIGRLAEEVDLPAGAVLMREGQTGHEFFLIVDGRVRVERGGRVVNVAGPGDFLGEIALVDGGPRSATATAEERVRAIVLGQREFHSVLERHPQIRLQVLNALAKRVRQAEPDAAH